MDSSLLRPLAGWYTETMDEWFCNIGGREIGPLSSRQLKAMADRGQIVPTDNVRRGGDWPLDDGQPRARAFCGRSGQCHPHRRLHPQPVPPPPPSIFSSSVPNVAWPKEEPAPEPERPGAAPIATAGAGGRFGEMSSTTSWAATSAAMTPRRSTRLRNQRVLRRHERSISR